MRNYKFEMLGNDIISDDKGKSYFFEFKLNDVRYEYQIHSFVDSGRIIYKIMNIDANITIARWTFDGRVDIMNADDAIKEVMKEKFKNELPVKSVA